MISEYKKRDASKILHVINDASLKYKGVIPDSCWHEPYMSEQELKPHGSTLQTNPCQTRLLWDK